jgi:hypothetical protein
MEQNVVMKLKFENERLIRGRKKEKVAKKL